MYYLPRGAIDPASLKMFPKGEPDETLRSIIARYSLITSVETKTTVFKKVFQRACLTSTFYTEDLRVLALQAAPLGQAESIYSRMLYGNTFHSLIYNFDGEHPNSYFSRNMIIIDDIRLSDSKFCVACIEVDIETLGFPFWRRSHQVPGVSCCWKHLTPLKKIQATYNTLLDSRRLFDPKKILTDDDVATAKTASDLEVQFAIFARDSLSTKLLGFNSSADYLNSRKDEPVSRFTNNYIENYSHSFGCHYTYKGIIASHLLAAYKMFGSIDVLESSLESI